MVLRYNETTSIPDYWISLTRQQQATESDKHTNTLLFTPSTSKRWRSDGKLGRRRRAIFRIPLISHPSPRSPSEATKKVHSRPRQDPKGPLLLKVKVHQLIIVIPNTAGEKNEELKANHIQLADIISTTSWGKQLHVGWIHAHVEKNLTGFLQ